MSMSKGLQRFRVFHFPNSILCALVQCYQNYNSNYTVRWTCMVQH